jgi:predicted ester cyclase
MSDRNRQIARRFVAAFVTGDAAILAEAVAEAIVDHNAVSGQRPGRQALADIVAMHRAWFPDLTIAVAREVAEGDLMVQYGTIAGTHTGELMAGRRPASEPRSRTWTCTGSRTGASSSRGASRISPGCCGSSASCERGR